MIKVWCNCLIAGTKTWTDVPTSRKESVLAELEARVEAGLLTEEKLAEIIGE